MFTFFSWLLLRVLHGLYSPIEILSAILPRRLSSTAVRIPSHLALALFTTPHGKKPNETSEETTQALIECAVRAIGWCRDFGIQTLTIYDRHGVLKTHHVELSDRLAANSTVRTISRPKHQSLPDTPPPSDHSSNASFEGDNDEDADVISWIISSPPRILGAEDFGLRRRNAAESGDKEYVPQKSDSLQVHIISYSDGRPTLARAARTLALAHASQVTDTPIMLKVQDLSETLECELPSPHLTIVHHLYPTVPLRPLELDAFPPWQLRLTELSQTPAARPSLPSWKKGAVVMEEADFRMALQEFADAEFREGK